MKTSSLSCVKTNLETFTLADFRNIALKNYSQKKCGPITEQSPYIELTFGTNRVVVKKTSFCWLLQSDIQKLSNDRLLRVQTKVDSNKVNSKSKSKHTTRKRTVNKRKRVQIYPKKKY